MKRRDDNVLRLNVLKNGFAQRVSSYIAGNNWRINDYDVKKLQMLKMNVEFNKFNVNWMALKLWCYLERHLASSRTAQQSNSHHHQENA